MSYTPRHLQSNQSGSSSPEPDADATRMLHAKDDPGATRMLATDDDPGATRMLSPRPLDDDPGATRMLVPDAQATVASPALGYGLERKNMLETDEDAPQSSPVVTPDGSSPHQVEPDPLLPTAHPEDTPDPVVNLSSERTPLSKREVAAVSEDRSYYVSNAATPYLSSQQAQEDVNQTRKRHRRTRVILITLLIVALLGGTGWAIWNSLPRTTAPAIPQYETANIAHGEFLDTLEAKAQVHPIDQSAVSTEISGTIGEVLVSNGDHVEEGQELVRLESPSVTESVRRAEDALNAAQRDADSRAQTLDQAKANLDTEQKELEKLSTGADAASTASKAAIAAAQVVVDAAKKTVDDAQTQFDHAQETLNAVQQTYDLAREQENKLTVWAPISGVVRGLDEDEVKESESVTNGEQLCSVVDESRFRLEIEIPEDQREQISEGLEARLTFPDIEDLGVVDASVSAVEERDDIEVAIVEIDDPDERINRDMTARVSLVIQSIPDSLIVPAEAVKTDEETDEPYLDVLLDPTRGIVTKVPVKVVAKSKTQAAVSADNIQKDNLVVLGVKDDGTDEDNK